ncbi:MAG: M48 family metallopeptidase [Alphaproteobacteria bacterium]|nr:M48 family metallopeptidase [Alphaproteobacteria bacterium]
MNYKNSMTSTVFTCGEQEIPLKHKPNPRAKRLSLRLSSKEQSLVLTIPPRASGSQISAFLKQCKPWVEKQLSNLTKIFSIQPGEEVVLHGTVYQCVLDPLRRKPALCQVTNTLRLPPQCLQEDLHEFFKKMAGKVLPGYTLKAAEMLGQQVEKITLRDSKSRWGSCSGRKTISLSWRLVLAPPEVAHYVCVHEAVHLIHMNHSPAFWQAVERLCPRYRTHKKWLKVHGPALMRI